MCPTWGCGSQSPVSYEDDTTTPNDRLKMTLQTETRLITSLSTSPCLCTQTTQRNFSSQNVVRVLVLFPDQMQWFVIWERDFVCTWFRKWGAVCWNSLAWVQFNLYMKMLSVHRPVCWDSTDFLLTLWCTVRATHTKHVQFARTAVSASIQTITERHSVTWLVNC